MARVTVEDCIEKVHDRFELVALASQRAKNLATGDQITIANPSGEKNTVVSLREIAAGSLEVTDLRENLVRSFQHERMDDDLPQDGGIGETAGSGQLIEDIIGDEMEDAEGTALEAAAESAEDDGNICFAEDNLDVDD